jgi:hypothetical protein
MSITSYAMSKIYKLWAFNIIQLAFHVKPIVNMLDQN